MRTLEELGISKTPWKAESSDVFDAEGSFVVDASMFTRTYCANARLIAAAPDCLMSLCETLTALKNRLPSQPTVNELEIIDRAEAAISKATGRSANTIRRDNHVY